MDNLSEAQSVMTCLQLSSTVLCLPFDFKSFVPYSRAGFPTCKMSDLPALEMAPRKRILSLEKGTGGFLAVHATALFVLIISDISQAAHSLFDGQSIKNN